LTIANKAYIIVSDSSHFINKRKLIMKKIAIASLFALVAATASAVEVGVTASEDFANKDRSGGGVTLGEHFGKFSVTAGFDRYSKGNDLDKYSVVGGYDVTKIGTATLTAKVGAAYLNQKTGSDGYAALVGAGVSIPVTSKVSATVDYRYQAGQSRVNNLNGSSVLVGAKYSF
jgi:opacity protein-like surface antigen